MPESRIWFLHTADGQQGPYTADEIRTWRANGQVTDEWHIWREGLENWQMLGDTREFAVSAPAALAPASGGASVPTKLWNRFGGC